ncbi:hypothetical protein GCM10027416_21960 [Okibacterium endophyticum]
MPTRTARRLTMPIVVAGSLAAAMNLTGPIPAGATELPQRSERRSPERSDAEQSAHLAPGALTGTSRQGTAPQAGPAASAPHSYTVAAGDTISGIAARYGLATANVLALNGLSWSSTIYPGQILVLTSAAAPAETAPPPASPPAAETSYTVIAGDTVSGIAARYGLSVDAILSANGLQRASIIYPGQQLVIPGVSTTAQPAQPPTTEPMPDADVTALSAEMAANARIIIDTARSIGVSDRGIVIALATAMQESTLRNLDNGHLDSLGLFQQRPTQGWGSPAEIMDPVRSTLAFFGGATNPNAGSTAGLLDIPGWEQMSVTDAAQAVQVSAYPDAYAAWERSATAWLAELG